MERAKESKIFPVSERQYKRASRSESNLKRHIIFYARQYVMLKLTSRRLSYCVCLSLCLSVHRICSANVSKQCKLGSANLHCRLGYCLNVRFQGKIKIKCNPENLDSVKKLYRRIRYFDRSKGQHGFQTLSGAKKYSIRFGWVECHAVFTEPDM